MVEFSTLKIRIIYFCEGKHQKNYWKLTKQDELKS
jgi:hypothetical protein